MTNDIPVHPLILKFFIEKANKSISADELPLYMIKSTVITNVVIRIIQGDLNENLFPMNWNFYKNYFYYDFNVKNKYRLYTKFISDYIKNDLIKKELNGFKRIHLARSSYYSASDTFKNIITQIKESNESYYNTYDLNQLNFDILLQKQVFFNNKYYNSINEAVKLEYITNSLSQFNEKRKYISDNSKILQMHNITPLLSKQKEQYSIFDIQGLHPDISHTTLINNTTLNNLISNSSGANLDILMSLNKKINNNVIQNVYYQTQHGRYYQSGKNLQFLSKNIRNSLLEYYTDVDIKASTFTILYNYSKEYGFSDSDFPLLYKFASDPDKFRLDLYNEFKLNDPGLKLSYIKFILNSIAFGAKFNEYRVLSDVVNKTKRTVPIQTEGYTTFETPLNVCTNKTIKNLVEELKFLTYEIKSKLLKDGVIINKSDKIMQVHPKMSYGKILSHLYQGVESKVLYNIFNFKLNDIPLISINNAIGLLLHDGLYIRSELVHQYDIINQIKKYIYEKMNYIINFG